MMITGNEYAQCTILLTVPLIAGNRNAERLKFGNDPPKWGVHEGVVIPENGLHAHRPSRSDLVLATSSGASPTGRIVGEDDPISRMCDRVSELYVEKPKTNYAKVLHINEFCFLFHDYSSHRMAHTVYRHAVHAAAQRHSPRDLLRSVALLLARLHGRAPHGK